MLSYIYLMEIGIGRKLSCCHGNCCCHGDRVAGVLLKQHLLSLRLDVLLQAAQVVREGVVLVSHPLSSNVESSTIQESVQTDWWLPLHNATCDPAYQLQRLSANSCYHVNVVSGV